MLAFGGMALKNSMVASGGISRHIERGAMQRPRSARRRVRAASARCATICRMRWRRDWLPITSRHRHGADARDRAHAARRGPARPRFPRPLLRRLRDLRALSDRPRRRAAKGRGWAAAISGIPAADIVASRAAWPHGRTLDHRLAFAAARRTWRAAGVDGRCARRDARPDRAARRRLRLRARRARPHRPPAARGADPDAAAGQQRRQRFIPVARIADMLLNPGEPFDYNGRTMRYPDIKLVYWAGGNPFHHHQDLNRLRRRSRAAHHRRAR